MKQTKEFLPSSIYGSTEHTLAEAKHFFDQYFASLKQQNTNVHLERIRQIELELSETGTYEFTAEELLFGAKLAWRNAARCIGRIQWQKLQLFDMRTVNTAREIFDAICNHIRFATNGGNLRFACIIIIYCCFLTNGF